jgi:hypothetical protein
MPREKRNPVIRRREDDEMDVSWHRGKAVSVGLILAVLLQCACFVWYGAQSAYELKDHDAKLIDFAAWRKTEDDSKAKIEAHLDVVDEKLNSQSALLNHMNDHLDKIIIGK